MQRVDGMMSARRHDLDTGGSCGAFPPTPCGGSSTRPVGTRPCVFNGGHPGVSGPTPSMTPKERVIDAVVGAVTAVIDVVVAVLERSRGGQAPTSPRPSISSPTCAPLVPGIPQGGKVPPSDNGSGHNTSTVSLQVAQDDVGDITVRTRDGYTVRAQGAHQGWSITSPEGKTTRVSPRQEVRESDGDHWRFVGRGSLVFGSNKATIETRSLTNGASTVSRVTVYSGADRVTVGGLDTAQPSILALARDGQSHDDGLSDGTTFYRADTTRGESWSFVRNGRKGVMGAK